MSSHHKENRQLVETARQQGFQVKDKKSAWVVYAKGGSGMVNIHKTPQDWRAVRNNRARLRRIGVEL